MRDVRHKGSITSNRCDVRDLQYEVGDVFPNPTVVAIQQLREEQRLALTASLQRTMALGKESRT